MRKGKIKKDEKRFLSIAVIPHSSGKVKVFKITRLGSKLLSLGLLLTTVIVCASIFAAALLKENAELKIKIDKLNNSNIEQKNLISEKAAQIENLRVNAAANNEKIQQCLAKYREITDKYFSGRLENSVASRSGERTERDFAVDVKELKSLLDDFAEINKDAGGSNFSDLSQTEEKLKEYMATIPTLWPVSGRVSDTFGYRRDPFTKRKTFHEGLDIGADYGKSIKAAADGTVIFAGVKSGYGRMVIIDHGRGITTAYGHASKLLVKEGQKVKKGQSIANVGSSGRSTGPHLHFEVRLYGSQVDPMKYLDSK